MEKPDVDQIDGLSPAIAIDQKTTSKNPRSTVGTVTEIYDYLRLLYARAGTVHCPKCGKIIEQQTVDQMIDRLNKYPEGTRLQIMAPVVRGRKGEFVKLLQKFHAQGYIRARLDGEILLLDELPEDFRPAKNIKHNLEIIIDRLVLRDNIHTRLTDSLEIALGLADGLVLVEIQPPEEEKRESLFSSKFACPDCDINIGEIEPRLFSFNNPFGACPHCLGIGQLEEVDPDTIIANEDLSINEGAIQISGFNFADETTWVRGFIEALSKHYKFSLDTPYKDLPDNIKRIILYGNDKEKLAVDTSRSRYNRGKNYRSDWKGVIPTLMKRYMESNSNEIREYYQRYMRIKPCSHCNGSRLKPEALSVTIGGLNIYEFTQLTIAEADDFIRNLQFSPYQEKIATPILREVSERLRFLLEVGLDYLTLSRTASTLSGGEAQRIRLATQIGSGLTGVLYILDEPSIGLHQRDNGRLLNTLKRLRDMGNTVIVVEHDEETIWEADHVIDIGPRAGEFGGEIVAQGRPEDIAACAESLTGQYLSGKRRIEVPVHRRPGSGDILTISHCRQNNLKDITVNLPLATFIAVTGVSGSGKSSLVNGLLLPTLQAELGHKRHSQLAQLSGHESIDKVIAIDQSPIGRTPRSNPATYTGVFDDIRQLFTATEEARVRGYKPGRFSFNVKGGRCEACKGDGVNKIEMHFLPDVFVTCDVCHGKRYNRETLEVTYRGKNIADVLDMTIDEALVFFENIPRIQRKLQTLVDVGLGYVKIGQPSTQLSGGEAQRVKLASELSKRQTGNTFYILDEPTTGLHTADVHRLIDILQRLVEYNNTVLVIEHNLDVIKTADYIVDLGPEGGSAGGRLIASGTPEQVAEVEGSYTGKYLKYILNREHLK